MLIKWDKKAERNLLRYHVFAHASITYRELSDGFLNAEEHIYELAAYMFKQDKRYNNYSAPKKEENYLIICLTNLMADRFVSADIRYELFASIILTRLTCVLASDSLS